VTRRPPAPVARRPDRPAPAPPAARAERPATSADRSPPAAPADEGPPPRRRPPRGRAGRAAASPRRGRWGRAARAVRTRTPTRRTALSVVVVLAAGALLAWALLVSPLTALRQVSVTGATRTDPALVRAAADGQLGRPLLRVDGAAVRRATVDLPFVRDVTVHRHWLHRVVLQVHERVPVAAVPRSASSEGAPPAFDLLDGDGAVITAVASPPEGVPVLSVDVTVAGAASVRAASAVALSLPADLRADVQGVTARSPDDVRLALRGGQEVRWGSAEESALKAQVLQALRRHRAHTYDVSAPRAPATS
jgi:cell division protein FtsQ